MNTISYDTDYFIQLSECVYFHIHKFFTIWSLSAFLCITIMSRLFPGYIPLYIYRMSCSIVLTCSIVGLFILTFYPDHFLYLFGCIHGTYNFLQFFNFMTHVPVLYYIIRYFKYNVPYFDTTQHHASFGSWCILVGIVSFYLKHINVEEVYGFPQNELVIVSTIIGLFLFLEIV
jgi:hypothetical protein